jgi:hypothetical protein
MKKNVDMLFDLSLSFYLQASYLGLFMSYSYLLFA